MNLFECDEIFLYFSISYKNLIHTTTENKIKNISDKTIAI